MKNLWITRTNYWSTVEQHSAQQMVHDTAPAETALRMSTNTGGAILNKHGKSPGMENEMWINPGGMANVANLGDSSDQCHVCFNNAEEDTFMAREWNDTEGKNTVKFPWNHTSNLHGYKFGEEFLMQPRHDVGGQAQPVSAVAENGANHSNEQCKQAKRA